MYSHWLHRQTFLPRSNLGPLAIEGHIGAPCFLLFYSGSFGGPVMELSAWLKLGKIFRLGGGGMGIIASEPGMDFFFYFLGVKLVLGDG